MPAVSHNKIPLETFFAHLRREGFEISTSAILDIQKVLANLPEADSMELNDLPYLMAPLICRNKEEQEKFYKVCRAYFDTLSKEKTGETQKQPKIPIHPGKILAAALVVAAGFFIWWMINKPSPAPDTSQPARPVKLNKSRSEGFVAGDTIQLSLEWDSNFNKNDYSVAWIINGERYEQPVIDLIFKYTGHYIYQLELQGKKAKRNFYTEDYLNIACEPTPRALIQKQTDPANGQTFLIADITSSSGRESDYSYRWYNGNRFISAQKKFYTSFNPDSTYNINLIVDFPRGTHCSADSLTATYSINPEINMIVTGSEPVTPQYTLNWANIGLIIIVGLLLPGLAAWYTRGWLKQQKMPAEEEPIPVPPTTPQPGETVPPQVEKTYIGPYTLTFNAQDDRIAAEAGISQLSETLRKRHSSDTYLLDIQKTIRATIRGGGFPLLQFSPKTKPADFLILLDKEFPDGHTTHLFSWVISRLRKEEVQFTMYSFYKEPLLLSNESMNQRLLPIDKVSRLYPDSIVLIFSAANGFFMAHGTEVKKLISEKFRSWPTKLIITPRPKNDWGSKELALYDAGFTVIPADMNAHQLIADEINYMIDKQKLKKTIVTETYGTQYNFNRYSSLEKYIHQASLSQSSEKQPILRWICATAVYPHVNWDITVAIGHALESAFYKPGQIVNYTNLLILSRIPWMNDGQVSESLRRDLLIHLDKEAEAAARKAVLNALKEIEPFIRKDSLVADEYVYLQTTNRFLVNNFNKDSELSAQEYGRMKEYVEKDQLDWVLLDYLSNPSNNSLLQGPNGGSITPEQFFALHEVRDRKAAEEKAAAELERKKRLDEKLRKERQLRLLKIAGAALVVGLLGMGVLSAINIPQNIQTAQKQTINLELLSNPYYPTLDSTQVELQADTGLYTGTAVDPEYLVDTAAAASPPMRITKLQFTNVAAASLLTNTSIRFNAGSRSFISAPDTLYRNYRISFAGPLNKSRLFVRYQNMDNTTSEILRVLEQQYVVSAEMQNTVDSTYLIYYNTGTKNMADSVGGLVQKQIGRPLRIEFIEENRTPPAPPILFIGPNNDVQLPPGGDTVDCSEVPLSAIPRSLAEIWAGARSNRLTRFDLTRYRITYSTGPSDTYGQYTITKVCLSAGVYKFIVRGNKTYRRFNVRNLQANTFDLSICDPEFNSEAEAIAYENCTNWDRMQLYYETNANTICLPLDLKSYTAQENAKIKSIAGSGQRYNLAIMVNTLNTRSSNISQEQQIKQSMGLDKATNITWSFSSFNGTPFKRSYVTINPADANNPANNNNNPPPTDQYAWTTIGVLPFDAKDYFTTEVGYLLEKMGSMLKNNPNARVMIELTYNKDLGESRANSRVSNVMNVHQKTGAGGKQVTVNLVDAERSVAQINIQASTTINQLLIRSQGITSGEIDDLRSYLRPQKAN